MEGVCKQIQNIKSKYIEPIYRIKLKKNILNKNSEIMNCNSLCFGSSEENFSSLLLNKKSVLIEIFSRPLYMICKNQSIMCISSKKFIKRLKDMRKSACKNVVEIEEKSKIDMSLFEMTKNEDKGKIINY